MFTPSPCGTRRDHLAPLPTSSPQLSAWQRTAGLGNRYSSSRELNIHISLLQSCEYWWVKARKVLCSENFGDLSFLYQLELATAYKCPSAENETGSVPKAEPWSGLKRIFESPPLGIYNEIFKRIAPVICSYWETPILSRFGVCQPKRPLLSSLFWQNKCWNLVHLKKINYVPGPTCWCYNDKQATSLMELIVQWKIKSRK